MVARAESGNSPREGSHTFFCVPFNCCERKRVSLTIWVESNQMFLYYLRLGTWQPSQCPPLFPGPGRGRSCQLSLLLPGELESSRIQAGDGRDQDLYPRGRENSPILESDNCAVGGEKGGGAVGGKPSSCMPLTRQESQSPFYRQRGGMTPLGVNQIWQRRTQIWEPET